MALFWAIWFLAGYWMASVWARRIMSRAYWKWGMRDRILCLFVTFLGFIGILKFVGYFIFECTDREWWKKPLWSWPWYGGEE